MADKGLDRLVWVDCEMTGLDLRRDALIEIAALVTDSELRILDEGIADCATIDWAMRTLGGFRMGPFELMDLIGNDVNFAVTRSVWEACYHDPRYAPSV